MDKTDSQARLITPLSRRDFLGGITAAAAASTLSAAWPTVASAQTALSPDAALQALLAGNKRFVEKRLTSLDEDLAILKQNTVGEAGAVRRGALLR